MLSLAPLLYRGIFSESGGPIAAVESSTFPIFNKDTYQAAAFLRPDLPGNRVDGVADGAAFSDSPEVARDLAISEALELWAFRETRRAHAAEYGFGLDRTSNGLAAFPGFKWQARRRARFAALERFALVSWWDRRVSASVHRAPYPGVGMVRIHHGQTFGEVVILFHQAPTGFVAYGHAAGATLATATSKAVVELVRSEFGISRRRACGSMNQPLDYFERRCLYFSTPEGHAEFMERVAAPADRPSPKWNVVYDGEIPGPWSQWTRVWRHCVVMPTYAFLDTRQNFFFW
ncbi:hypothetical protein DB347_09465 [Opitutaceae bacterium EW11]|nr:hypothetical protein DB347_09465 [Opitutaceae bacterium EW11]